MRGEVTWRQASSGTHVLLRTFTGDHQLWSAGPLSPGETVTAIVPIDANMAVRTDALLRFRRSLGSKVQAPRRALRDARLRRVRLSLRALDGRRAGASYRQIAEHLVGSMRIDDASWKTSCMRDTVIRLVRCGTSIMNGGYRRLIARKPR